MSMFTTCVKFAVRRSGESFYDRAESFFIRRKLNKFEAGNIYTPEKLSPSVEDFNLFEIDTIHKKVHVYINDVKCIIVWAA